MATFPVVQQNDATVGTSSPLSLTVSKPATGDCMWVVGWAFGTVQPSNLAVTDNGDASNPWTLMGSINFSATQSLGLWGKFANATDHANLTSVTLTTTGGTIQAQRFIFTENSGFLAGSYIDTTLANSSSLASSSTNQCLFPGAGSTGSGTELLVCGISWGSAISSGSQTWSDPSTHMAEMTVVESGALLRVSGASAINNGTLTTADGFKVVWSPGQGSRMVIGGFVNGGTTTNAQAGRANVSVAAISVSSIIASTVSVSAVTVGANNATAGPTSFAQASTATVTVHANSGAVPGGTGAPPTFPTFYAPFGNSIFGETKFGVPPTVSVSAPLSVQPYNYDSLLLRWTPSTGNWNEQILVRSSFGTPQRIYDGVVLLDETYGYSNTFIDTGLKSGNFYYYALFVFDTDSSSWVLSGAAQGLVLTDYGFGDTFLTWLPNWYDEQDDLILETPTTLGQGPLDQFLGLIGFEMDWIRSEIESLFLLTNVDAISGALLPLLGGNFGVTYEPELGMTRSRVLVKNAVYLYQTRGTVSGIQGAATSFSGYGCTVTIGKNLEIQLDDSTFDRSIGHWVHLTNCTMASQSGAAIGVIPAHGSYTPANNVNIGLLTGTGGVATISTCSSADAVTLGLPIPQQASPPIVVVSQYFRPYPQATPVLRSFYAQIDWYATNGAFISSSVGAAVAETSSGWVRPFVVASPPPGAVTYGRTFKSTASLGNGEMHLVDGLQSEYNTQASPGPTSWDPPRDIKINLFPIRQNLLANPNGFLNAVGWLDNNIIFAPFGIAVFGETLFGVPTGSAVSAVVSSSVGGTWPAGTVSGFTIQQSSGSVIGSGYVIPVNPGEVYSFSGYFQAVQSGRSITLSVAYMDVFGNLIKTFSGQLFNDVPGSYVRGSVTNTLAPANAFNAVALFSITGVSSVEEHLFGAMLFEPSPYLLPYFDGNSSPSTDYLWEGIPNLSVSDYYPDLGTKLSRLGSVMVDYVPIGSTYSTIYAKAAFTNVGLAG